MNTITIGERVLDELFPDFTKHLVAPWTRGYVDDLAAEVPGAIGDGTARIPGDLDPDALAR